MRHGQSQANAGMIIADANSPLTALGVEQARQTGLKLKPLGVTTIVCSPYVRARQTAQTIAEELGIEVAQIKIIDELRERSLGDYENKPKTEPSEWYAESDALTLEPRQALLERMIVALQVIQSSGDSGLMLVVGHAVSGSFLIGAARGAKRVDDLVSDDQIGNADFVRVQTALSQD